MGTRELFLALRDALKAEPGQEVEIDLLVDRDCEVKKVKAFLRMSGCEAKWEERDGGAVLRITGGCCSCR